MGRYQTLCKHSALLDVCNYTKLLIDHQPDDYIEDAVRTCSQPPEINYSFISDQQHAPVSLLGCTSTETALVRVVDNTLRNIYFGSMVVLVSLDISAAFDTINHDMLLCRLQSDFRVCGTPLQWISSCLIKLAGKIGIVTAEMHMIMNAANHPGLILNTVKCETVATNFE